MKFHTTTTFRNAVNSLLKKPREGYQTVVKDICNTLLSMPVNIIRETNERIIQKPSFRVVKLRVGNSGQKLAKANGFRLIYLVSMETNNVVLLNVYPKRGAKGIINISDAEYCRLLKEMHQESITHSLHEVDINDSLAELSTSSTLP